MSLAVMGGGRAGALRRWCCGRQQLARREADILPVSRTQSPFSAAGSSSSTTPAARCAPLPPQNAHPSPSRAKSSATTTTTTMMTRSTKTRTRTRTGRRSPRQTSRSAARPPSSPCSANPTPSPRAASPSSPPSTTAHISSKGARISPAVPYTRRRKPSHQAASSA